MSKSVVRSVKNVTKGYSSVQIKVRNATSNDAWGPSGTDMSEIARMTYNNSSDFYEIMDMLDKRMNDKGKNWRHVLKSLKVLDYILHEGSEIVCTWARKNLFLIKTLREFQYTDEDGRDVGANIRQSAKELTSLILDEERLRAERQDRKLWKSRVTGLDEDMTSGQAHNRPDPSSARKDRRRNNRANEEDDLELRLAIEASKNELEEEKKRRERGEAGQMTDDDLAKAIRLSKEEEELRRRELEEQNAASLFDDTPTQQPQATGWNQGYQQQSAVDWFGNPVDQQQPQSTGFLNNAYAQQTGMQQPQQTGFQNGFGYDQSQYQQPGYNQFQNQGQFQQPQANYMQPQQTAFNMNNPYAQQSNGFGQNLQQQQQQPVSQPGSNNPWATTDDSRLGMKPQQTGSNNPFASSFNRPQTSHVQRAPTLNTLQEQKTATQFNQPTFGQSMSFSAQQPAQPSSPQDPHHARLNALLASGEGQDTFGNTGEMRIPAQHTAPGNFVNSAGAGINRLPINQTGGNPFLHNQFTGMPQQQMSAQTGYGGGYGSSSHPFGGQQRQGQQGGSLIDL